MARIARNLAVLAATIMLAAGAAVAALPAASASASTAVEAWFSGGAGVQLCSDPGTFFYTGKVVEVYNPCSVRVWVHYTAGTKVQSFCVNPGGGIAYDLPITWAGGDTTDIQVTTTATLCDDRGAPKGPYPFVVFWNTGLGQTQVPTNCDPAQSPPVTLGDDTVIWINTFCDYRIWLHANANGSGASHCVDPNPNPSSENPLGIYTPSSDTEFKQIQPTEIQAPCAAGSPPYSP